MTVSPDSRRVRNALRRLVRPGIGQLGTHPGRALDLKGEIGDNQKDTFRRLAGENLPTLSVVVPSFNQGRFLSQTLESILDQAYPRLELIVVDGGSSDDSPAIIRSYEKHIRWWVSEPDNGQAHAINKGFAKSSGEVMAWINSDDLVAPGAFFRVMRHFYQVPSISVVYGNRVVIDEGGREIGRWTLPGHSARVLRWADFVPQETLYWRRSAWDATGARLDESFRFAMDWDFLLRLAKSRQHFVHLPYFLGLFRVHHNQKTSAQMSTVGESEIQKLRLRELGFNPPRLQVQLNAAPFLLKARLCEIGQWFKPKPKR